MPPITKPTSHKKKKKWTRKESPNRSLHLEDVKKRLSTNSRSVVTPVLTQTQGEAPGSVSTDQLLPSSLFTVGPKMAINQLPLPPVTALSELVSGCKPSLHFKSLLVHKESQKNLKVARLNDNIIFTFRSHPSVNTIASAPDFKPR
jgi:hypothetical protein